MNDTERLQAVYRAAGREIRKALLAVDPANYSGRAAAEARARVGEIVRTLNVAADRWTAAAVAKAYGKAARTSKVALQILGKSSTRKVWDDKRRAMADALAVTILRANASIPRTVDKYLAVVALGARALGTVQVREYTYEDSAADIGRMAENAMRNELSHGKLATQIRDYVWAQIQNDEFIEIVCVDGIIRTYQMGKYVEMVARTTLREAATAATLDLCQEYDNDLVLWSNPLNPCGECAPHAGEVYSISGNDPDYDALGDEPPLHPNCECSLLPTSREAISAKEARQ